MKMKLSSLLTALSIASPVLSQSTSTPTPTSACPSGLSLGNDTIIFTVPYTYSQVISIIGSFRNLTWSGSPYDSVTLNGSDNTVGTARTYDIDGAHVVETLDYYSKPALGPYVEIHSLAYLTIPLPSGNVSLSGSYDGTTVTPICNGQASTFNFTILFCATNVTVAGPLLHSIHMGNAQTVGMFLGGQNFSSCAQFASSTTAATKTASASTAVFTGAAARTSVEAGVVLGLAYVTAWLLS